MVLKIMNFIFIYIFVFGIQSFLCFHAVAVGASCAITTAPSTLHIPCSWCPHAVVAFSDFWILQADQHRNLGVYITKWEWGLCLSDSSSPQAPICWCGERGRSRLVAAAPTLESWDPKGAGMAPGREEATHPRREASLVSENKTFHLKTLVACIGLIRCRSGQSC